MTIKIIATATVAGLLLSACGGGGGGGGDGPANSSATATKDSTLPISGVAATGLAMASASIKAKCVNGSASVSAKTDGSFKLDITNGSLPCLLQASDGSTALHSIATSDTAQITPMSELMLAHILGQDPKAYFDGLPDKPALATTLGDDAINKAQTAVRKLLLDAGVAGVPDDILHATLVAATQSGQGNGYDGALDALKQKLTDAGSRLADVSNALAAGSKARRANADTDTVSAISEAFRLPADLLLKKPHASCPSLRSGDYRMIRVLPSTTIGPNAAVTGVALVTVDTSSAAVTLGPKGSTSSATPLSASTVDSCHYKSPAGEEVVVSPAGVMITAVPADTTRNIPAYAVIGIPEQTIAVSELAGTWNTLGSTYHAPTGTAPTFYTSYATTLTLDSTGAVTRVECDGEVTSTAPCAATPPEAAITATVNPAGGFDFKSPAGSADAFTDRWFAYRSGTGALMIVDINAQGELHLLTRQRTLGLPSVGDGNSTWDILQTTANTPLSIFGLSASQHTVKSVDAAKGSVTRGTQTPGKTPSDLHDETFLINNVRNGYFHRQENLAQKDVSNQTYPVLDTYSLNMKGMGLTLSYVKTPPQIQAVRPPFFAFSVTQTPATAK